mgnify:CR=1 FL=1
MAKWYNEFLESDEPHHNGSWGGRQRIYRFPNGYSASVIPEYIERKLDEYEDHENPERSVVGEMMPKKVRKAFEILDYCIWLIVGLVVFVTSVEVVINDFRLGRHIFGTNIPMAAASLAVPAGWFFAMIRILQNMYRIVKSPDNEEEKDKNLIVS